MTVRALPRPRPDDDRGVVAVVVAASLAVFLGLAAIVVDLGNARDLQRQAQNAADAGALGAAQFMAATLAADPAAAVAKGRSYVTANGWDGAASAVSVDVAAGTVDVTLAPRHAPGFFSGAVGGGTPTVGASARAIWHGGANLACALCVLGDYHGQAGTALVVRGSVAVNGTLGFTSLQGTLTATPPGTIGYYQAYNLKGTVSPEPVKLAAPVTDPFAWLKQSLPPPEADPAIVAQVGTGSCRPGVYTDVSGCGSFTGGGTYVITGSTSARTIAINADAPDSLFYVTCFSSDRRNRTHYAPCGPGVPPAQLFGAGTSAATITARTSGPYQGFAVVWDPAMDCSYPSCKQSLVGNGALTVNGVSYGPSITFGAAGNGSLTARSAVVVGGVQLAGVGSGAAHISIDATPTAAVPPVPAALVRLTR